MKYFTLLMLVLTSTGLWAQGNDTFPVQTKIENGTIEGLYDTRSGLQLYLGVPLPNHPLATYVESATTSG